MEFLICRIIYHHVKGMLSQEKKLDHSDTIYSSNNNSSSEDSNESNSSDDEFSAES